MSGDLTAQMRLFQQPPGRLEDVPLKQRMAAVEQLLAADPGMSDAERWQLFGLVICPQVFGTVER
jgi:hypothetical protein